MPLVALTRFELRTLWGGWLVRLWAGAAVLLNFLTLLSWWQVLPNSLLVATLLFPFLVFPWFLVIITLGANAVGGARLETLADGFLSRPITRLEFILASWLARAITVLAVFALAVLPVALIGIYADRPVVEEQVTVDGMIVASVLVVIVLLGLLSLGFLLGILLRNGWIALILAFFVWYPINVLLATFRVEEFSPISLNQAAPVVLRKSWFLPGERKEQVNLAALQEQFSEFMRNLMGPPQPQRRERGFFSTVNQYEDIQPARVGLSYGLVTILLTAGAYAIFYWRDL